MSSIVASLQSAGSVRSSALRPLGARRPARSLSAVVSAAASPVSSGTPSAPATPVRRDYSVSFFDAMKFNGPAPELINGRLAMVGIVAGAMEEASSSSTLAQQAAALPLAELLGLGLLVWASLVPIMKGAKMEAFGMFTPRAEITNGRAAMLALAVLLALEDRAHVPFF